MKKDLIVIKFGTASIAKNSGEPNLEILEEIAQQVSQLHSKYRIVLVSSGAVGAGKAFIKNYEALTSQKKAAAAIGNPILLKFYDQVFSKYGITVAQSLIERSHFANRKQFLQLKETYEELWNNDIIPIANENDVVSNREIKFSDNDELATLIAVGFNASKMMLCTASGGLLNQEGKLLSKIDEIDETVFSYVSQSKTALGSGGMASKLTFTHLANKMGIEVVIFGLKQKDGILDALNGKTGTSFKAKEVSPNAKTKWMASGSVSVAKVFIDAGAEEALKNRKSLLSVGVIKTEGEFKKGQIIELVNLNSEIVGVGKCKLNIEELNQGLSSILIHTNDLVLF